MAFSLPALPYGFDALEPSIDAQTMQIHHGKHHQAYVNNLNAAIEKAPELGDKSLEDLCANLNGVPEAVRTAVRNNGGGHWNHSFFWKLMGPNAGGAPTGAVADAITSAFGDFEKFKTAVNQAGTTRFGSGWAWVIDNGGKLEVTKTANADLPLKHGQKALWTIDVWEHAYYIDYRNARPKFIDVVLDNLINWDFVNQNLGS